MDWSGARESGRPSRIWLAEVADGALVRLQGGWTRRAVTDELVSLVHQAEVRGERVRLGLDFSFGFPAWYLHHRGWRTAEEGWRAWSESAVDRLLAEPALPFWGRGAVRTRPSMLQEPTRTPAFRDSERRVAHTSGVRPFSVFQLVGAGSVGVASLRGMTTLCALHDAGAQIWPFPVAREHASVTVLELWPRLCAPAVHKSNADARVEHVARLHDVIGMTAPHVLHDVRRSDDAFDALVAAHALWRHRETPLQTDVPAALAHLEGAMWVPPS